jgi:hypothetical protein
MLPILGYLLDLCPVILTNDDLAKSAGDVYIAKLAIVFPDRAGTIVPKTCAR